MEPKFKVGDKVIRRRGTIYEETGTISKILNPQAASRHQYILIPDECNLPHTVKEFQLELASGKTA